MNRASLKSESKSGHRMLGVSTALVTSIPASIKVFLSLAIPAGLA